MTTIAELALTALHMEMPFTTQVDAEAVFNRFGHWTERTPECLCLETTWVRFADGSRLKSENGQPWDIAMGRRNERKAWLARQQAKETAQ